jgi:hypothetical protein
MTGRVERSRGTATLIAEDLAKIKLIDPLSFKSHNFFSNPSNFLLCDIPLPLTLAFFYSDKITRKKNPKVKLSPPHRGSPFHTISILPLTRPMLYPRDTLISTRVHFVLCPDPEKWKQGTRRSSTDDQRLTVEWMNLYERQRVKTSHPMRSRAPTFFVDTCEKRCEDDSNF